MSMTEQNVRLKPQWPIGGARPVPHRPQVLMDFLNRVNAADSPSAVERLRADELPLTVGLDADELLLAEDWCDDRIFALTGHRLPPKSNAESGKLKSEIMEMRQRPGYPKFPENFKVTRSDLAEDEVFTERRGGSSQLKVFWLLLAVVDMVKENDWDGAIASAAAVVHALKLRREEARADAAGVVGSKS
jgi:hypothetical protein